MASFVALADRAFVDENYEEAVELYSKALAPGAKLGDWTPSAVHEARAYANFKLGRFMEAVQDAGRAVELDPGNVKAYLRKGMAAYRLQEYETALATFQAGLGVQPNNAQMDIWIQKCKNALTEEGLPIPDTPAAPVYNPSAAPAKQPARPPIVVRQHQQPAAAAPKAAAAPAAPARAQHAAASEQQQQQQPAVPPATPPVKALAPAAPDEFKGKYRHQWYQIGSKVVVDVYAKGLPADAVAVALNGEGRDRLRVRIAAAPQQQQQQQQGADAAGSTTTSSKTEAAAAGQQGGGDDDDYVLELDLFGGVAAHAEPVVEVLRTKVEISLAKADSRLHWPSLEKGAKGPAAAGVAVAAAAQGDATAAAAPAEPGAGPPRTYPSSKGPKDWSKVEAEVRQLEEAGELEDGDPLNSFFKKIFAQGDEDTRRAMMKSFVESNGTVLSTNWQEVGAKAIECTPPEGMELHKWNE